MSGFSKWKHPPGTKSVNEWADEYPEADLVYIPGLSRTKGGEPIVVLDGDDAEACGRIVELFGDTPGKVRTRRGQHHLYTHIGHNLGKLASLKAYGINADVKHGRSIVVAPPSRHEKDRTFSYAWDACNETVIRDLPSFNVSALQELIDRAKPSSRPSRDLREPVETQSPDRNLRNYVTNHCPAPAPPSLDIRNLVARAENSRGLALNKWLCRQVWACDSLDALFDCARAFDQELIAAGLGSLGADNELVKRTAQVWKDRETGKIQPWAGARAVARTDADEVKDLCSYRHGGDAVALLMLLRSEHGARVQRGETFALRIASMEKCKSLDWSAERFTKARDALLKAGYIQVVKQARNTRRGRVDMQYTLVPRTLSVFRELLAE